MYNSIINYLVFQLHEQAFVLYAVFWNFFLHSTSCYSDAPGSWNPLSGTTVWVHHVPAPWSHTPFSQGHLSGLHIFAADIFISELFFRRGTAGQQIIWKAMPDVLQFRPGVYWSSSSLTAVLLDLGMLTEHKGQAVPRTPVWFWGHCPDSQVTSKANISSYTCWACISSSAKFLFLTFIYF